MNTESHPDTDLLKAYSLDCESREYDSVRMHLARCASCRNEVDAINALVNHYDGLAARHAAVGHAAVDRIDEQSHQQIIDYVEGDLQADEQEKVAAMIRSNDEAMKAALHYASHRSAMSKKLDVQVQAAEDQALNSRQTSPVPGFLQRLSAWLDFRTPLWLTLSSTAIAVLALVYMVPALYPVTGPNSMSTYTVASYQDNPVIQYRAKDALPGMGFFSKAEQFSTAYTNVEVAIEEETSSSKLVIRWPKVKRAMLYTMRLQMFDQGGKKTIGEITTDETRGVFTVSQPGINKRYEWVLSGTTSDEKTFYSTGGFIISKSQQHKVQ